MKKAFTLVELLVILVIVLMSTSVGIAYYNKHNQQLLLKSEARKLADILELAKKKAESSELIPTPGTPVTYCSDFNGYRIGITNNRYTLRFRCNSTDTVLATYNFPSSLTYTGSSYYFHFLPLGLGNNITLNTVTLKNANLNQCIDISITTNGVTKITETLYSC